MGEAGEAGLIVIITILSILKFKFKDYGLKNVINKLFNIYNYDLCDLIFKLTILCK